jgi:5'-deoxynucleotidase YfbR-like HD superfamily hydrolase
MQSLAESAAHSRAWQRMLSGRRLDLLDPSPFDIEIEDIAHGLARVARWNGQTDGEYAFSVAEHSLLVEKIASELDPKLTRRFRLAALIHDAPEYVIGDLISPFKAALSLDYRAFEAKLLAAIHLRFGLPAELPDRVTKLIKRADKIAAYYEATGLAGFSRAEARRFFGQPRGLSSALVNRLSRLSPLPASAVEAEFLKRFKGLHR